MEQDTIYKKKQTLITREETNKDAFTLIKIRPHYIPPLPPTLWEYLPKYLSFVSLGVNFFGCLEQIQLLCKRKNLKYCLQQ